MGDGTGCDNMTAVIAKIKPEAFKDQKSVSAEVKTEAAEEATGNGKRPHDDEEANNSESCPEAKKAKTENSDEDSKAQTKPETKSD